MSKIRKLHWFDKKKVMDMVSLLNNVEGEAYLDKLIFNPFIYFHHFLPLRFKYLPESFVLKDGKDIKALVTVITRGGVQKRAEIKKMFFEEFAYDIAGELVQYAVSKYKAMGAFSVMVKVDDFLPQLISMLVTKCGFTQLSYEKMWNITRFPNAEYDKKSFRHFRNSDSQAIAGIYNDSLLSNYRPLLSKNASEFKEPAFAGLFPENNYKYTIIDIKSKNIIGCISITTSDNNNYIAEIIHSGWAELEPESLISFIVDKIKKRTKKFRLFIKTKKYSVIGEKYDKIFIEKGYECVQNRLVLTNSSARILKAEERTGKYTLLTDFCPPNAMPT